MYISERGINLIKEFEGFEPEAYQCPSGTWTIGYGSTANVKPGDTISLQDATNRLLLDLQRYESRVRKYQDTYHFNQNEFDALVSFCYNIGNIDQLTDNGTRDRATIADKMLLYNKSKGKVLNGLVRRRQKERELFLTPVPTFTPLNEHRTYSLAKDGNTKITDNFKVKEFRCHDGSDTIRVNTTLVHTLQHIRDHFNQPVYVNSAYRTESWNTKVGGAKRSYHLTGDAVDISVAGYPPSKVAAYAYTLGVKGIIQYNTFVHLDARELIYYAIDDGKTVTKVGRF